MLLVKAFAKHLLEMFRRRWIWEQRGIGKRWNYFLLEKYSINVTDPGMRTKLSQAVSSSYYWMLVWNNYLLAKKKIQGIDTADLLNLYCVPPGHIGGYSILPEEDNLLWEMSQEGFLSDCPPKPLSQHWEGINSEWTDKTTLISIT